MQESRKSHLHFAMDSVEPMYMYKYIYFLRNIITQKERQ